VRTAGQHDHGDASLEQGRGEFPHCVMRGGLDHRVRLPRKKRVESGDERHAEPLGERLPARAAAPPDDRANPELAQLAARQVLEDEARNNAAADDADAHATDCAMEDALLGPAAPAYTPTRSDQTEEEGP
jgi:hypothetical protein